MARRRADRCAVVPPRFPRRRARPRGVLRAPLPRDPHPGGAGRAPRPGRLRAAFPEFAERLRLQMEVHKALSADDLTGAEAEWPQADGVTGEDGAAPVVPGYELLDEIGRGGMGIVYRGAAAGAQPAGRAEDDPRRAARPPTMTCCGSENEAEAIAALDHPNIVPILEVGESERLHYFTMKLIDRRQPGPSGDPVWPPIPAPPRGWCRGRRAVHHAHQRGILHRDLKPANILLDDTGRPHVTDFGLAKRVEGDTELTQPGAVLGYAGATWPPSRRAATARAVTTATDVYGLGAILYALLTGRASVRGATRSRDDRPGAASPPEPPRGVNRGRAARPGDDLPEVPGEGTGAALPLGCGGGRRPAALAGRRADQRAHPSPRPSAPGSGSAAIPRRRGWPPR